MTTDLIEVRYKGRLGNNLFQYCLGRILAEELGFALLAEPIPGFLNTAQSVNGVRVEGPEKHFTGHRIDLAEIFADRRPRRIVLDGWFQRHEYYRPYRAKICEWLRFDPAIRAPDSNPDVVVNVRRMDYVQLGWALPFLYYARALEQLKPNGGTIWIVTDDSRDPFFRKFAPWQPQYFSGTALEQMLFMARARRLVMSQSTFSWWPTFLGHPNEVICPVSSVGAWSEHGGEAREASLIERDRFTCIECGEPYQPTKSEVRHQERRLLWRRLVVAINRRAGLSLREPPP